MGLAEYVSATHTLRDGLNNLLAGASFINCKIGIMVPTLQGALALIRRQVSITHFNIAECQNPTTIVRFPRVTVDLYYLVVLSQQSNIAGCS